MKNKIFFALAALVTLAVAIFLPAAAAGAVQLSSAAAWAGHDAWKRSIRDTLVRDYTVNGEAPIVQDGFLRIEKTLTTGTSNYTFKLQPTPGTDLTVEQKLDQNDIFVVTEIGIFIYEQVVAEIGREIFQTYPSPSGFANVTAANVQDLDVVYNGRLNIKVGNTTFLPDWELKKHRFVPIGQQGTTTAAIAGPTTYTLAHGTYDMLMHGFVPLKNAIKLSGQGSNDITITLPVFDGCVLTHNSGSYKNQLVFNPRGFIVKNRAQRLK